VDCDANTIIHRAVRGSIHGTVAIEFDLGPKAVQTVSKLTGRAA